MKYVTNSCAIAFIDGEDIDFAVKCPEKRTPLCECIQFVRLLQMKIAQLKGTTIAAHHNSVIVIVDLIQSSAIVHFERPLSE
ncbi:hypothetical protein T01_9989 [Trichinella spiralis]|uniref:Uncharacterized protein n=1 Tax=Trichinella spiralis TaxID=6334 RepID=A0A0V1BIL0_TRISP|nr:hypothetical protein T01_9989 [Trichinella spiralis]